MLLCLSSVLVWLTPVVPLILLVGCFICFDTIMGVIAAKRCGIPLKSRRLAKILSKMFIYTSILLLVYGMDFLIISTWIPGLVITKVGVSVLCFVEGYSIDEKLRKINNDKGFIYYISKFIHFIKSFKDVFNDIINGK